MSLPFSRFLLVSLLLFAIIDAAALPLKVPSIYGQPISFLDRSW